MKTLLALLFGFVALLAPARACDIMVGTATLHPGILLTLQPGVPEVLYWDLRDCGTVQNYTLFVTKPRPCRTCTQKALSPGTKLTLLAENLTTGAMTSCPGFICGMGCVTGSQVQLTLLNSGNRPLDVEVTTTAALGGVCP